VKWGTTIEGNNHIFVKLGGGNANIFGIFTPKIGEDDSHFDEHMFQRGWFNHQLENLKLFR